MSQNRGEPKTRIMLDRKAIKGGIRRQRSIQNSTYQLYRRRLNRLRAWCEKGSIDYDRIRGRQFADYLLDLYEGGYRYDYLRGAWTAFKYAYPKKADKKAVRNVLKFVQSEDDHVHRQAVSITSEEIDRLYAALRVPLASGRSGVPEREVSAEKRARRYYVAFLFMFYCGLRSDELTRIEWADVTRNEDGSGTLYIAKSKYRYNDPYTKPIPARVMYEWNLMQMASTARKPFPTYRYLARALKRADEESGIQKGFTTHSFKVGMANFLVQKGYSTKQIADAMGWRSERMVRVYTRNNPGQFNALQEIGRNMALSSLWVGGKRKARVS